MTAHILFGTSSWGLGHSTRDLVLMRALLEADCSLTVVATGKALKVLQGELGDAVRYLDWPDIPTSISARPWRAYAKTVAHIPQMMATWRAERRQLRSLLRETEVDAIVSDHRFGLVVEEVPSYVISHSLREIAPGRDPIVEASIERFLAGWLRSARAVFIPDDPGDGLTGEMSHNLRFFPEDKRVFLGPITSVRPRPELAEDVDVFITISGPEPQRTMLQEKVFQQLPVLAGRRVVVALGQPDQDPPPAPPGVEVHSYLDRAEQEEMLNRSRVVVCRSGYSTISELVRLGKRALLVPTPGQMEQRYLAASLSERGLFHSVAQSELDLGRDIPRALASPGYRCQRSLEEGVRIFRQTVLGP